VVIPVGMNDFISGRRCYPCSCFMIGFVFVVAVAAVVLFPVFLACVACLLTIEETTHMRSVFS